MSKVYFKEGKDKYSNTVYIWDTESCNVLWEGGINTNYTKADFEHFTRFNYWILCNKDGSPIKTKNSVKRPTDNWKKTINKYKFDRCIKECVDLGAGMYYNPATNCFYGKDWCNDDSEAYFKYNLSKVPKSKSQFKADVLTIYNEYLEDEMKQSALQRDNFNESEYPKEDDRELFSELKEGLEECVNIKKEREKSTGGKSNYYKITLPEWLIEKQQENGYIMLEDLAETMFDNDFNFTNVFKAQKRMFEMTKGGGKEGNTFEYDATKVKYYTDKQVEVFNR